MTTGSSVPTPPERASLEDALAAGGLNAVRSHHARALHVLGRRLRGAILLPLVVTAVARSCWRTARSR